MKIKYTVFFCIFLSSLSLDAQEKKAITNTATAIFINNSGSPLDSPGEVFNLLQESDNGKIQPVIGEKATSFGQVITAPIQIQPYQVTQQILDNYGIQQVSITFTGDSSALILSHKDSQNQKEQLANHPLVESNNLYIFSIDQIGEKQGCFGPRKAYNLRRINPAGERILVIRNLSSHNVVLSMILPQKTNSLFGSSPTSIFYTVSAKSITPIVLPSTTINKNKLGQTLFEQLGFICQISFADSTNDYFSNQNRYINGIGQSSYTLLSPVDDNFNFVSEGSFVRFILDSSSPFEVITIMPNGNTNWINKGTTPYSVSKFNYNLPKEDDSDDE